MKGYLTNLEALPAETATPLEFKAWYERNKSAFDEAKKIPVSGTFAAGSNEALIADAAKNILERRTNFIAQYEIKKAKEVENLKNLNDAIVKFDTNTITEQNFAQKQAEFEALSNAYIDLRKEIIDESFLSTVTNAGKLVFDWAA